MTIAKKSKFPKAKTLRDKSKPTFLSSNKYILLSFLLPFVLMTVAYAWADVAPFGIFKTMVESIGFHLHKIFPFIGKNATLNMATPWGSKQILVVDLWHQYYPFLVDLQDKLQSGGSLFWSWAVGMGSNFIAMMSYYLLSPLNFLSVFVPTEALVGYLAVITVIKISLAGMFTAICFRIIFKKNDLSLVFFSVMYSLCSFCMGYYWCTIWLDSFAMLPLVVAGTVCLLRDGKYKLFIISLALSVIFNYYIGLFICAAVLLTAIGYTASCWKNFRKSLKDLLRTVICSVTSLLLTAPITVPAFLALQNCYKSTSGMPTKFDINIGTDNFEGTMDAVVKIFSNFISFLSPTSKEGLPNVSCGILCLVLLAVFFCTKKVRLGEKIFCISTLLFLVASFIFRHLDYVWHGFHYPNMLPYRFSFLVSFLLIYMSFRAFMFIGEASYLDVTIGALIYSLFVLMHFLRPEDSLNKGAAIASAILGGVMILFFLLYTLKALPKRALAIILCLLVTGEMCATAIIGVKAVSTTTMSGYPRESKNVARILSHVDMWAEKETPDIFRTEVTSTQTLNDGALNGYKGISMFNSMANVSITKFTDFMGCAGWKAGNRYTYYESSPVTNTILNLRYLIARDGKSYTGKYMEEVDRSNNVTLYENTQYVNMGFLTESRLSTFTVADSTYNPFENQINFWKLATGINEPLYTQLTVKDVGHSSDDKLSYSKTSEGVYTFSPKDNTSAKHIKFNFYPEEDGMFYAYFYVSGAQDKGSIYINDANRNSINVKQPYISAVGNKKEGDKISLYCNLDPKKTSSVRVFCYALNEEVYEAGIKKFKEGALQTTTATDTVLEGTVTAKEAGLLYTSIPYEKGWSVSVDGKPAEVVAVGDAMCAVRVTKGTHTIKFSYVPDGFVLGTAAFISAALLFTLMCICTSNKFSTKAFAKPVSWIFDPQVPERIKKKKNEETEAFDSADTEENAKTTDLDDETVSSEKIYYTDENIDDIATDLSNAESQENE